MATKKCTVCLHAQVAEIDAALVGRMEILQIAAKFGISRHAIGRHRDHVVEMRGLAPKKVDRGSDSTSITEQVLELEEELKLLLATARRTKNRKDQLTIIDKLFGMIEFRAKLSGAVKQQKPGASNKTSDRSEGFHGELEQLIERRRLATKPS